MLLALGPVQLDAADSVVIFGIAEAGGLEGRPRASTSCDLVWLRGTVTPEQVSVARQLYDVPVGVDVDDVDLLPELAECGAVAAELRSPNPTSFTVALERGLTLWCTAADAKRAAAAGYEPSRIVVEAGAGPGVPGVTQYVDGPGGWGSVFAAVVSGARVVRTTDVRSVRRVVAVTDRLLAIDHRRHRTVTE